jgi:hypothetical protein
MGRDGIGSGNGGGSCGGAGENVGVRPFAGFKCGVRTPEPFGAGGTVFGGVDVLGNGSGVFDFSTPGGIMGAAVVAGTVLGVDGLDKDDEGLTFTSEGVVTGFAIAALLKKTKLLASARAFASVPICR